jgi:hypothetical protein
MRLAMERLYAVFTLAHEMSLRFQARRATWPKRDAAAAPRSGPSVCLNASGAEILRERQSQPYEFRRTRRTIKMPCCFARG